MMDRITAIFRKGTGAFGSFSPGQKAVTIFAVVALVIGGYFFATWAGQPTYAPLFSGLTPVDANSIVDQLNTDGVPYKLTDGGTTIMVPDGQVYDERIKVSAAGLPSQGEAGYELLDKQGVTTSEFMQQITYRRALEGELSKTIKSIDGVKTAAVHLAIPEKDVFTDDTQKPTASVLVDTGTRSLTSGQVQSVVHLVASSVEGLDPANVTVVGANGKVLSASDDSSGADGAGDGASATTAYEQRLNGALQKLLETVLGPNHSVVQVTADLDFDSTETKTQRYVADPTTPAPVGVEEDRGIQRQRRRRDRRRARPGQHPGAGRNGQWQPRHLSAVHRDPQQRGRDGHRDPQGRTGRREEVVRRRRHRQLGGQRQHRPVAAAGVLGGRPRPTARRHDRGQFDGLRPDRGQGRGECAGRCEQGGEGRGPAEVHRDGRRRTRHPGPDDHRRAVQPQAAPGEPPGAVRRRERRPRRDAGRHRTGARQDGTRGGGGGAAGALESSPASPGEVAEREARQRNLALLVERQPDEVAQLLRGWLADRRS